MSDKNTEDKIIAAALKEFALHGFDGARIDTIAKNAGVNKAMIYYYFKNKESLYEQICKNLYTKIVQRITDSISNELNPAEQLIVLMRTYFDLIRFIDEDYMKIMHREIASGGKYFKKLAIPNLINPMSTLVSGIIEEGKAKRLIKEINPRYTFMAIIGAVLFFNAIRMTIANTDFGKELFPENYQEEYNNNLIMIISEGIFRGR